MICLTELGCTDPEGWFYDEERAEAICPWCIAEMELTLEEFTAKYKRKHGIEFAKDVEVKEFVGNFIAGHCRPWCMKDYC